MNIFEAFEAMAEGKKVRNRGWYSPSGYWCRDGDMVRWHDGVIAHVFDRCCWNDWEIYEEPYTETIESGVFKGLKIKIDPNLPKDTIGMQDAAGKWYYMKVEEPPPDMLPDPWGNKAELKELGGKFYVSSAVACFGVDTTGPDFKTPREAIENWNAAMRGELRK